MGKGEEYRRLVHPTEFISIMLDFFMIKMY